MKKKRENRGGVSPKARTFIKGLAFLLITLAVLGAPFSCFAVGEHLICVSSDDTGEDYVEEYEDILGESAHDVEKLPEKLYKAVRDQLCFFSDKLSVLLGFVLLLSVAGSFFEKNSAQSKCLGLAGGVIISSYVIKTTLIDTTLSSSLLTTLSELSGALLPLEASMLTAAQKPASAILNGYSLKVVTTVTQYVISGIAMPLVTCSLALCIASPVCEATTKIADFMKKCAAAVTVTSMTVVTFYLALRSTLSSAADSVAMRSVRFAVGSFVPMVGGALSEAAGYVAGSFTYVKNTCGIMAIVTMLTIIAAPLIKSALSYITLSIAATASEVLPCGVSGLLRSLSSLSLVILICEVSSCVLFIIRITLFVKAGGV